MRQNALVAGLVVLCSLSKGYGQPTVAPSARTTPVVLDTTPPVLALLGATSLRWNFGDTWVDPGYTATDNLDSPASLHAEVVISAPPNIRAALGSVTVLTYSLADAAGNSIAAPLRRTVVISDLEAPVIQVDNGTIFIPIGGLVDPPVAAGTSISPILFEDPCVRAVDNHDGLIPPSGSNGVCVDTETHTGPRVAHVIYRTGFTLARAAGFNESQLYVISFAVQDNAGNEARAARTLVVESVQPINTTASPSSGGTNDATPIAVAAVVVMLLLVVALLVFLRRRRQKQRVRVPDTTASTQIDDKGESGRDGYLHFQGTRI